MATDAQKGMHNGVLAHSPEFVPAKSDVVPPAVLSQVFEGKPIPFKLDEDGSVKIEVYLQWLREVGEQGLAVMEKESEIIRPQRRARAVGR